MEHPLLAKVQAWQEPSDTRSHDEWLAEQLAISEAVGGSFTHEEVMAYIEHELEKAAQSQNRVHESG
ncbi:MAG: hypothetical protein Q4D91_05795 [Lautropia sp.]|nr:hypothetical protein [Lautropia sp.]